MSSKKKAPAVKAEVETAGVKAPKVNALDAAIADLEALPHLNYAEAKDKLLAVLKLLAK
jgi:hypothetical protein